VPPLWHAGWVSDVVPPGGDQPPDDVPWPVTTESAGSPPRRLPGVPAGVPADVVMPPDWRTLDNGELTPPGYRPASGRATSGLVPGRLDRFGLAGCVVGVVGLIQLVFVSVPIIALLAFALGVTGRRSIRLDPERFRFPAMPIVGVALGTAGIVAGVALTLVDYA